MTFINTVVAKYLNDIRMYDFATYLHSCRVARIAVFIGQELGMAQPLLKSLEDSALLHDLGKTHVPKSILNRTDQLTNQDWIIIKKHPVDGVKILRSEKSIYPDVISGVITHHEHFNGSGYPFGLNENKIPIFGRIIAIADALDAMISIRPYRRVCLSVDEAIGELMSHAGYQFDPYILDKVSLSPYNPVFLDVCAL